ncbi:MAG: DUF445 family protein [Defluviitaleaceae bacterium]|nr:DUF445 family protein [Defluviitaleaceae bacterium]
MDLTMLVTPILGAIIGYCTNFIAVRMLFRPHRAIFVFGVKIPFTPGIIPKGRERLAKKLANVVGDHILTPGLLTEKLISSPFISKGATEVKKAIRENIPKVSAYLQTFEYPPLDKEGPIIINNLIKEHVGRFVGVFLSSEKIYLNMKEKVIEYLSDESNLLAIADKIDENIDKFCDSRTSKAPVIVAFEIAAEQVVKHIDIKATIEDRVNAFKPEEAEELVLSVIRRELHLIMALGGVLGFIIGLIPVIAF